jgi:hypothetical protein
MLASRAAAKYRKLASDPSDNNTFAWSFKISSISSAAPDIAREAKVSITPTYIIGFESQRQRIEFCGREGFVSCP